MSSVEALTERVKQLEQELSECRRRLSHGDDAQTKSKGARPKINVLSAEVVDTNPYRFIALYSLLPSLLPSAMLSMYSSL